MISEAIIVVIVSASVAVAGLGMRLLYSSKCTKISLCGICSCERDVASEQNIQIDNNGSARPIANNA